VLDYGSWQGLIALALAAARPEIDASFAHSSATRIAQVDVNAKASELEVQREAMFPIFGQWETIVLDAPEQSQALEMMANQAATCLAPQGQLLVVDKQSRRDELGCAFSDLTELAAGQNWTVTRCSDPRNGLGQLLWRKIDVIIRDLEYELETLPGNFSPQGLDAGTRAMLEVAQIPAGGRVLDLACGYGVVGITAAKLGGVEVVYVDECLAALAASRRNLQTLGLKGELVHSHLPRAVQGKFDCILTNPPYHADYGVAKSFLEFAVRRLNPHGWLYVVVKKPDWYVNKIRALFGGCRVTEKDGYYILSTQLRQQKGEQSLAAKTTRKHMRRQQAATGRGRNESD
jgi:16S rRNA (guanine1207-N2)-methyltransferase